MRALQRDLTAWVRDGKAPPPSGVPHIADGTLTPPDRARFSADTGEQLWRHGAAGEASMEQSAWVDGRAGRFVFNLDPGPEAA
jgi:hypothetical protein